MEWLKEQTELPRGSPSERLNEFIRAGPSERMILFIRAEAPGNPLIEVFDVLHTL